MTIVKVDVRDSMVKVFAVQNHPDYTNPWNMFGPISVRVSGCVIAGNRFLTNAHVVSDQTFIQVRTNLSPPNSTMFGPPITYSGG